MKVQDFITTTLKELIAGVKGAQKYAAHAGGAINPSGLQYLTGSSGTVQHKKTTRIGTDIEFDIEVTVREEKKKGGKVGAKLVMLSSGIEGQTIGEDKSVNRIKFKVPVIFPKMEYIEEYKK